MKRQHWTAPTYVYHSSPSFGAWDAMFMWMMLDNINNASYARTAYNHSDDPAFREWRKEAEELAKDNEELKAKLDAMDEKVSSMTGEKDPNYLPEDVPVDAVFVPEVSKTISSNTAENDNMHNILALAALGILGSMILFYMFKGRR